MAKPFQSLAQSPNIHDTKVRLYFDISVGILPKDVYFLTLFAFLALPSFASAYSPRNARFFVGLSSCFYRTVTEPLPNLFPNKKGNAVAPPFSLGLEMD